MKMKYWLTAMGCALITFIVLWVAVENLSH